MSHLQPKFVAKIKANLKQSQIPRRMPRTMLLEEARGSRAIRSSDHRGDGWYSLSFYYPDYRIFSLKK